MVWMIDVASRRTASMDATTHPGGGRHRLHATNGLRRGGARGATRVRSLGSDQLNEDLLETA